MNLPLGAYVPQDRRWALARGMTLPERASGAALFADIAGFTPLTEAFAHTLGARRGAESLTRLLNQVYDALNAEVERFGGSVIGFSGDAITCWFGDETASAPHLFPAAWRAVLCALALQRSMSAFASVPLPDRTTTTLTLKIVVTSGPARRFVVGDPAIQLIDMIAGATITRIGVAEHLAHSGEIVADVSTVAALGKRVVLGESRVDRESHERFFVIHTLDDSTEYPTHQPPTIDVLSHEQARPWLLPSVADRLAVGLGEFLTELRPTVALFLRFSGIDHETDVAGALLDRYIRWVQGVIARYGGTLIQLAIGDKGSYLYAAFGAPLAHEDDAQRAALAAFELRSPPPELAFITPPQIGISRGMTRSGAYGSVNRRTYGVLGDDVNLAARLMQRAVPGEVLISDRVVASLVSQFVCEQVALVTLKGKRDPIPVARLVARRAVPTLAPRPGSRLVGRGHELAHLHDLLRPIAAGQFGGVVILSGEAGIGKSRLLAELRDQCEQRGLAHWLSCPAEGIICASLHPFRTMLRRYFNQDFAASEFANQAAFETALAELMHALPTTFAPLCDELERTRSFLGALIDLHWPDSLYEQLDPQLRFDNQLLALRALICAESVRQPLVVQIEDAHWLDDDSAALIQSLVSEGASWPLIVVISCRPADNGASPELRFGSDVPQAALQLAPLKADAVEMLAATVLGSPINDDVVAFLAAKTAGNPFFVEQLALSLHECGTLMYDDGRFGLAPDALNTIPDGINAVLVARLDRLRPALKAVVQTAAVLGVEWDLPVLRQMMPNEGHLSHAVQQAASQALWGELRELHYRFCHGLLRDAAYEMQVDDRLRMLHATALRSIELEYADTLAVHAATLVYHAQAADDRVRERRYARLAGEQAAVHYANTEALIYFSRALELTPIDDEAERATLLLAREQIYDLQGARATQAADLAALDALVGAAQLAEPARTALQATVCLRRAAYAEALGEYQAARDAALAAVELAEAAGDQAMVATGLLRIGRAAFQQGDYANARPAFEHVLQQARAEGLPHSEAESLRNLGLVAMSQNNYPEALDYAQQAIDRFHALGDLRGEGATLANRGAAAYFQGDYASATVALDQALQIARTIGDRRNESEALVNLSAFAFEQAQYKRARTMYEQALTACRTIGNRWGEIGALSGLGNVATAQGDFVAAQAFLDQALIVCRQINDPLGESTTLIFLGSVAAALGDYPLAHQHYTHALALLRPMGQRQHEAWVAALLGWLFHMQGDNAAACTHAQHAHTLAADVGARYEQSMALTVLGHGSSGLGSLDEAQAAYSQALVIQRELGIHQLAIDSLAGLARVAAHRGDYSDAAAAVEQIVAHINHTGGLDGTVEPVRVLVTCFDILLATGDLRAYELLARATDYLHQRANAISDPVLRETFLMGVPANCELLTLSYQEQRTL